MNYCYIVYYNHVGMYKSEDIITNRVFATIDEAEKYCEMMNAALRKAGEEHDEFYFDKKYCATDAEMAFQEDKWRIELV